jgi:ppGpp synthetase/RelA/SpoT-type nucleotidyltranferase
MKVIDTFMVGYIKEYDYYREFSRICADLIESKLESNGIRSIVTYRAKRPERLRQKLISRDKIKHYSSVEQIYADIIDFSGVRVALYFPNDADEVKKIIKTDFNLISEKDFPEEEKDSKKRFSGYWAKHYRCSIKSENLSINDKRYLSENVEIQIASVLMHAWSEVEHDLVYKPLSGIASEDELAILDLLNGLVLTGEIALERLQIALRNRTLQNKQTFPNHYDLANYLYSKFMQDSSLNGNQTETFVLGRVDILFQFLNEIDKNRVCDLEPYLEYRYDLDEDRSIINQLVDYIISNDMNLYKKYQKVRRELENKNPFIDKKSKKNDDNINGSNNQSVFDFLNRLMELELVMQNFERQNEADRNAYIGDDRRKSTNLAQTEKNELNQLKKYKNNLIHGLEKPSNESIEAATKEIEAMIAHLKK